jgi:acyl-CoA dehydrogenase
MDLGANMGVSFAKPFPRQNKYGDSYGLSYSARTVELQERVMAFVREHVQPGEAEFKREMDAFRAAGNAWQGTRVMERLKDKARSAGLWNMFLPDSEMGAGITNLEYAPICEIMGRYPLTGEAMNCSAPDTGNMETWSLSAPRQSRWLNP